MRKSRQAYPPELDRLELTLRRMLEAHDVLRRRAHTAEARVTALEATVRDLAAGSIDPVAQASEIERLERANQELRERLQRAYESVERIRARLQFAEEEA